LSPGVLEVREPHLQLCWRADPIEGTLLPDIKMHSKTPLRAAVLLDGVPHMGVVAIVAAPALLQLMFNGLLATDDVDLAHTTLFKVIDMLVHKPEHIPYRLRATLFGDAAAQPPAVRQAYFARVQDAQPWLDLGDKMCEVLLVHGEEDSSVFKEKTWEVMRDAFGSRVTKSWIKDAGHMPFLERPDECRGAILTFVKSVI